MCIFLHVTLNVIYVHIKVFKDIYIRSTLHTFIKHLCFTYYFSHDFSKMERKWKENKKGLLKGECVWV